MRSIRNNFSLDNIIFYSLILYILDVMLLGTGELTKIMGVSTRMIFFFICIVASVIPILKRIKNYLTNLQLIFVILFFVLLFIAMILGVVNKNHMPILISDIKGFMHYLIVFPMVYILSTKEKAIRLCKIILNFAFGISILCIFLSYFEFFPEHIHDWIYVFVNKYHLAYLSVLTENTIRVLLHSGTRMMALGLFLAFGFLIIDKQNKKLRFAQMVCCLVAAFLSFARAIYLGLFLAVVLLVVAIVVWYKDHLKHAIKTMSIVLGLSVILITALSVTQQSNLFGVAWTRCMLVVDNGPAITQKPNTGDTQTPGTEDADKDDSDKDLLNIHQEEQSLVLRGTRKELAIKNFLSSPLIGKGLGVVNDVKYSTIEYFYLDLLSKMGVLGCVVFLVPAVLTAWVMIKNRKTYQVEQRWLALASWLALVFMMIISYFNPCMNTSWGLMIYGLSIATSQPWKQEELNG